MLLAGPSCIGMGRGLIREGSWLLFHICSQNLNRGRVGRALKRELLRASKALFMVGGSPQCSPGVPEVTPSSLLRRYWSVCRAL